MELLEMFVKGVGKALGWMIAQLIFLLVELVQLILRLFRCLFIVEYDTDAEEQEMRDAEYDRREQNGTNMFLKAVGTVPGILLFLFAIYKIIGGIQNNLTLAASVAVIFVLTIIALVIVKSRDLTNNHPYIARFAVIAVAAVCIFLSGKVISHIEKKNGFDFSDYDEQYTEPDKTKNCTVNQDGLNLREGPGVSYDVITVLPYGTEVSVLDDSDSNWWKVTELTYGYIGFVNKKYLSP